MEILLNREINFHLIRTLILLIIYKFLIFLKMFIKEFRINFLNFYAITLVFNKKLILFKIKKTPFL